ncbi:MAG TPA: alpha/beta hydrolase [Herpetosiphonaceae bacterium]
MREELIAGPDGAIWTAAQGAGPPLVLCPGGPGCPDYLGPVAALIDDVATVIRYDPPGCGRSAPLPAYSIDSCLAALELIRLHHGLERWTVAGHSAGADLALIYALRYPERVERLICLAGGRMNNDREWHAAYSRNRDAGLEPPLDFRFPPNMEVNAQVNADQKRFIQRPRLWREIAELRVPALFVYGAADIRPSWPVEQVARLLPAASFVLLDADHHLWLGRPDELRAALRDFLAAPRSVRE